MLLNTKIQLRNQLQEFDHIPGEQETDKKSSTIYIYKMFLAKEKALYMNLNMTRPSNNAFIGYFWAPVEQENTVLAIVEAHPNSKVEPFDDHFIPKPTYIKTTPFISVFQQIVDTYGIPSYQEANPAVISIVTFPFLFGMMFGDVWHGSIIFTFAAILVLFNKSIKGTWVEDALPLRYILLLMGFMSVYCGFLYNEFFAFPMYIFNSCYNPT